MRRYTLIILFICINLFCARAYSTVNNKILIISSYGSDYRWSNNIIKGINEKIAPLHSGIETNVEFLSSEFLDDPSEWGPKMDVLLRNYRKNPPMAIVLISDEAWMAYLDANTDYLKDVPVVLCAVKPHTINTKDFIQKKDSLTLSDLTQTVTVMKNYNATGVLRKMNTTGFISLMKSLISNLDRFVFITDQRFYGIYTRLLLQQEAEINHSKIPTEYIDARFISTDSLLSKLPDISKTAGILLTSWLTGEHGFEFSKDYVYSQMESKLKTPIFITSNIGLEKEYFVGGYFNDGSFWGHHAANILIEIYKGRSPKDMNALTFHDEQCQISWKVFNHYKLDLSKLPARTIIFNQPEPFFAKYKYYLLVGTFILIIVLAFTTYTFRRNIKLRNAQRLLLHSINETELANEKLEKTHQNLVAALEKAEESDRLKSAFIANMSHEIRTPLNAIVGFSAIVAETESQEERMEYAGYIQNNSDLLLQLISDILDLSKIEAGSLKLSLEHTDAISICTNVVDTLLYKCKPTVKLSVCESKENIPLYTDINGLTRVLANITGNAIKFTHEGKIELGYFSYNDKVVEFYIKDTGIGIAKDQIATIFDRFVKVDNQIEGTGLGLPICKTIIEKLGGEIGVESTLNVGSRFWFRVPKDCRDTVKHSQSDDVES